MIEQIQDDPRRVAGEGELASDYQARKYQGNLVDDCEAAIQYDPAGLEVGIKAGWVNPDFIAELKAKRDPNQPLRDLFSDFNMIFGRK